MAVVLKKGVYIVAGKRTPFGKLGGSLRDVLPEDLFATAAKGAFKACGVAPEMVDTVNIGQIDNLSERLSVRHAALKAGVSSDKPALGVHMLSGSAFKSIIISAEEILIGSANVALAGGMENLSSIQFVLRNIRYGTDLGTRYIMEDQLNTSNYDTYCGLWLLQTADVLAKKYGISRSECDEYALESQRRWAIADEGGIFDAELTPVSITIKHKDAVFMKDEHPRPNVTLQQLNKLPNMYKDGVVTSGHLCGVCDGAAAVILCNDEVLNKQNVKPLSRIVGWSWVGVDPAVMGLGPIPAVQSLLSNAKLTIEDVDIFETKRFETWYRDSVHRWRTRNSSAYRICELKESIYFFPSLATETNIMFYFIYVWFHCAVTMILQRQYYIILTDRYSEAVAVKIKK